MAPSTVTTLPEDSAKGLSPTYGQGSQNFLVLPQQCDLKLGAGLGVEIPQLMPVTIAKASKPVASETFGLKNMIRAIGFSSMAFHPSASALSPSSVR